jgi:hypothetical protein
LNQRWNGGRDHYRPADPINPADYCVAPIPEAQAKRFVEAHHYSGTYPAARWRFGLFHRRTGLAGVAVLSHPCNDATITATLGVPRATDGVELGRFVLLDEVPGNAESWMLGRCFRELRCEGLAGVVSFSDPCRRLSKSGDVVFGGHYGCIYQAHNAVYLGRSRARTLRVLPDGSVLSERAVAKVAGLEQGWEYVVRRLVAHGAEPSPYLAGSDEHRREWLQATLAQLTRPLRHRGNHKYAWPLHRAVCLRPFDGPRPKGVD